MVRKGVDLPKRKKEKRNMADRCTACGLSAPNHRVGCDAAEAPDKEVVEDKSCVECGEDPCACEEEVDYSSMKVAELKELLNIKGLETTGKKANLIERLEG